MLQGDLAKWQTAKWQIRLRLGKMYQTVICARRGRLECLRSNMPRIMPWNILLSNNRNLIFYTQMIQNESGKCSRKLCNICLLSGLAIAMMFNDERSSRASLVAINFYEIYLEIQMFEILKKSMRIILQQISKPSRPAVTELLFDLEKQNNQNVCLIPHIY